MKNESFVRFTIRMQASPGDGLEKLAADDARLLSHYLRVARENHINARQKQEATI